MADRLLRPIEAQYQTYRGNDPVSYIVVLGGAIPQSRLGAQLEFARQQPAARDGRRAALPAHPGARMVFTGASAGSMQQRRHGGAGGQLGRAAQRYGDPGEPRDTEEEAAQVAKLVGEQPFILVTSANHLPRAMRFFERKACTRSGAGQRLAIDSPLNIWDRATPSSMFLGHTERARYETLGSLWQWLKGADRAGAE
ncbi:YdcF family protein [Serratia marcescens]|uniref:YdcF family protein n=1 Tax=Serratia marcescens TaxID=615 RepID=A0A939NT26_SERMA|nr:YdcF family protein [Serratia marcescens]